MEQAWLATQSGPACCCRNAISNVHVERSVFGARTLKLFQSVTLGTQQTTTAVRKGHHRTTWKELTKTQENWFHVTAPAFFVPDLFFLTLRKEVVLFICLLHLIPHYLINYQL